MTISQTNWAMHQPLKPVEKLILIKLCEDGSDWTLPDIGMLCVFTGKTPHRVHKALYGLKDKGLISMDGSGSVRVNHE